LDWFAYPWLHDRGGGYGFESAGMTPLFGNYKLKRGYYLEGRKSGLLFAQSRSKKQGTVRPYKDENAAKRATVNAGNELFSVHYFDGLTMKTNPGSARTRYATARQMERLGRNIAANRVTKKAVHAGLKLQRKAKVTLAKRNPKKEYRGFAVTDQTGELHTIYQYKTAKKSRGPKAIRGELKKIYPEKEGYKITRHDSFYAPKVTLAKRNPKRRVAAFSNSSARKAIALATQDKRSGLTISANPYRQGTAQYNAYIHGFLRKVSRARRNPAPIQYARSRASKFHIIEGLVRDSPHDRKFSYWYWNGAGFDKSRDQAYRYQGKSAAETSAKKLVGALPPKILQIRVIES
jgi:hypothetical protein